MAPKPEYYVLTPVYKNPNAFVNASVGFCRTCGGMATGMGGSDHDICLRCAEVLISGEARGAIVWEDK